MKKLFLMMCVATLTLAASAQTKAEKAVQKKLDKSDLAIENPKKASSISTWISRADIYVDAAMVYTSTLLAELPAAQLVSPAIAGDPLAIEEVQVGADTYSKYVYSNFDVYVSMDGAIKFWDVKKEMIEDAMGLAIENLAKAKEVNEEDFMKSSKAVAVADRIMAELSTTGVSFYTLGKYADATKAFDGAFSAQKLVGVFDTISCYYCGVSSVEGGDFQRGVDVFETLISANYLQDGLSYYYLATAQKGAGDIEGYVKTYETGFKAYPQNSTIMAGLINAYMETERNPEDIILLIKQAEEIDPKNVSLYLVEADIWEKAGKLDEAYSALDRAIEIDPNSVAAYYNYAVRKVLESDAVVEKANKLDINDVKGYNDLIAQTEQLRKESVSYLEKCLEIEPGNETVLGLLGQMYFVCRDYSDEYKAKNDAFQAQYGE